MDASHRLFMIRTNPPYFDAGECPDGTQILLGVQLPNLVAVVFDPHGVVIRVEEKALTEQAAEADEESVSIALREWKEELRFSSGSISVREFFLDDRWIGVRELPEHYQMVRDDPAQFEPERRAELQNDIADWVRRGDYVLYWDEAYYMNSDGEVESS